MKYVFSSYMFLFGRHMNGPQKITKLGWFGATSMTNGNLDTSISESQKTYIGKCSHETWLSGRTGRSACTSAAKRGNWDAMNLESTAVAKHPRSQPVFPSIIPFIGEAKNKSLWMRKISLGLLKFGICDDCDGPNCPNPNIKSIDI